MFKKKNSYDARDVTLKRLDKIDKALNKLEKDIKGLKQQLDDIFAVNGSVTLINDEQLWQKEQKERTENGF